MGILTDNGVEAVHHYAPLHYIPFIGRSGALLGKPSLEKAGFSKSHLRSMSSKQDMERGFGEYGFLTLDTHPRILSAKLKAGFPHIGILVPASAVEETSFALCRYNVAMTRYLRRDGKAGFPESATSGRYYGNRQIPIAREDADKTAMLNMYVGSNTMIELLVEGDLHLPNDTAVICYSDEDEAILTSVLKALDRPWAVIRQNSPGPYNRKASYAKLVEDFVNRAMNDADWRGDGLEFDRV